VLSDPPSVVEGGVVIGHVGGAISTAIRGCLEIGYRFVGHVESFDEEAGTGNLDVQGERREVA
jgi:hypothetical protein